MIRRINEVLDTAIYLKNEGFDIEANRYVRDNLYGPPGLSSADVYNIEWKVKGTTSTPGTTQNTSLIRQYPNSDDEDPIKGTFVEPGSTAKYGETRDGRAPLFYQYKTYNGTLDASKKLADPNSTAGFYAYGYEVIEMLKEGFSQFVTDTPGKLKYREVTEEENIGRMNYKKSDYRDYLDGDIESSMFYNNGERKTDINNGARDPDMVMYQSDHEQYDLDGTPIAPNSSGWPTTFVSNRSKVYKGGSWKDRAYWLAVGNRRFLDEDKSMATIGFRCCMDRIGSPTGMNYTPAKRRRR